MSSKLFTIEDCVSTARELTKSYTPNDVVYNQGLNFYKIALMELYSLIARTNMSYYDYRLLVNEPATTHTLVGSVFVSKDIYNPNLYKINTAQLKYEKILSVKDYSVGVGLYKDIVDFDNIVYGQLNNTNYLESFIWTEIDDNILVYYGNNIKKNVIELVFKRLPKIPKEITEYADIPDVFYPIIVNRIASLMEYQKSGENIELSAYFVKLGYEQIKLSFGVPNEQQNS